MLRSSTRGAQHDRSTSTPSADLEDVGEVASQRQLHPEIDRTGEIVGEGHPLPQPAVEQQLPKNVHAVLGSQGIAPEGLVVHRQVDLGVEHPPHRSGEQGRRAAGEAKPVVAEDSASSGRARTTRSGGVISPCSFASRNQRSCLSTSDRGAGGFRHAVHGRVSDRGFHGDRGEGIDGHATRPDTGWSSGRPSAETRR